MTAPTINDITVTLEYTVQVREPFNVCTYFRDWNVKAQRAFFDLDIVKWGCENEWERPIAWLWCGADDRVCDGDIDWCETSESPGWTEDKFNALVSVTPWMKTYYAARSGDSWYRLYSFPGPDDAPLFELGDES